MPDLVIPSIPQIVFLGLSAIAIAAAILMITRNDPVHSALSLVVVLFQLAGMYVLLNAPFLAVLQVLVYAGAILVLFLFVIMLLQIRSGPTLGDVHPIQRIVAWPIGALLGLELVAVIVLAAGAHLLTAPALPGGTAFQNPGGGWPAARIAAYGGEPRALGIELYTKFLWPFEIASLILLVAVIGAIVLAAHEDLLSRMAIPTLGISLGRRVLPGSPQAEQIEKVLAPEVPELHHAGAGTLDRDPDMPGSPDVPHLVGAQPSATGRTPPNSAARSGEDVRPDDH